MCNQIVPTKVAGFELVTPTGVNTSSDAITPDKGNGKIIGVSVAENYTKDVLSQVYITAEQSNIRPFENTPLSVLFANGERLYFPVSFDNGVQIKIALNSKNATISAANKINLVFHFSNEKACK